MKSADLFADAIHVKLTAGKETGDRKMDETIKKIKGGYDLVERFINIYYDPASLNLAEVAADARSEYQGLEEAFSLIHFLLAGDFFDKYEKYANFLDMIKNPATYGKWKNLIVDSIHDAHKYGYNYDRIFGSIVEEEGIKDAELIDK